MFVRQGRRGDERTNNLSAGEGDAFISSMLNLRSHSSQSSLLTRRTKCHAR